MLVGLPSYQIRFQLFGLPLTVLEIMILASFAVWFLLHTRFKKFIRGKYNFKNFMQARKNRLKYPFAKEIVGVLIISVLALFVAGFSDAAMGIWKAYFFEPIMVFILLLNVFQRSPHKIVWSLTISAFLVSIIAITQRATGWFEVAEFWPRATGPFPYPNALGLYLGPLTLVMIGWFFSQYKIFSRVFDYRRVFLLSTIVLSVGAIALAQSEGALAAVIAGLVVVGLLGGKKLRITTLGFVVIFTALVFITPITREYAIEKITLRDLSGEIRKQQWRETWAMLRDGRIITGTGLSGYQKAVKPFHQEGIFFNKDKDPDFQRKVVFNEAYHKAHWQPVEIYFYPHNIFLNFWTELGILGALLFTWIIIKYSILGIKLSRKIAQNKQGKTRIEYLVFGLVGAMIVVVIHGLVDVPYFKNDLAVMFWVMLATLSLLKVRFQLYSTSKEK
jgi:O-antigen ligase